MKSTILTATFSFAALIASAAYAAPQPPAAEARLKAAVSAPMEKIFDGRVWRCENDVCLGSRSTKSQPPVRECQRAARELGAFASYRSGSTYLSDAQLAACNPA